MHLITAAVLSLIANKNASNLFKGFGRGFGGSGPIVPSFPGLIEKRHALPGRFRFWVPMIAGDAAAAEGLADKLPILPEVTKVDCDVRSGSVLVTGNSEMNGALVVAGIAKILGLEERIDERPVSKITTAARDFWRGLDRVIYAKSRGLLTVKDAVGIFLLIASVFQIRGARGLVLPPSFTLLWWLFHLTYGGTASS